MANPEIVSVNINQITRVAQNVTAGIIKVLDRNNVEYAETYRMTGDAAPTDTAEFFPFNHSEVISSTDPIDVYLYVASTTRQGSVNVRVDV
jgi:hypothetical protein